MVYSKNGPINSGRRGAYDQFGHWHDEPTLLPEDERVLPETVPHEYLGAHTIKCRCAPCARFPDQVLLRQMKAKVRAAERRRGSSRRR
jgi:hypothetical protein